MQTVWQYLVVFAAAAVPLVEVLVVIPGSVAAGLDPVPVGVAAFLGNASTLTVAVVAADSLAAWGQRYRQRRQHHRGRADPGEATGRAGSRRARRMQRVRRIATRWGLPGLAVLGPLTVGSHVAALGAVALRLPRRAVLAWSVAGVAAWSVVLVVLAAAGRAAW